MRDRIGTVVSLNEKKGKCFVNDTFCLSFMHKFCMLTPEVEVWVYGGGAKYTPGLYLKGDILQGNMCFPRVVQKDIR